MPIRLQVMYWIRGMISNRLDQVNGDMDRYALLYGSIMMRLKDPLIGPDSVPHISTTLTGLANLLTTIPERPLQFNVEGYPEYRYVPYWQSQELLPVFR
jgi:hypothetical protein